MTGVFDLPQFAGAKGKLNTERFTEYFILKKSKKFLSEVTYSNMV